MHIPPQRMEIEKIFAQLLAKRNNSIAISSTNPGEGVTGIALALAQRSLLAGYKTLLVDLNLHHPAFDDLLRLNNISSDDELLDTPGLITTKDHQVALMGITAPDKRELVMMLRRPEVLKECIKNWQLQFDKIIFDTSSFNRVNSNNIPPELVAAACDGVLLIVLAGHTTEAMVSAVVKKINVAGAKLLGCVFNDRDNPSLKSELQREVLRFQPRFNWLKAYINKFLDKNRLLKLEI